MQANPLGHVVQVREAVVLLKEPALHAEQTWQASDKEKGRYLLRGEFAEDKVTRGEKFKSRIQKSKR